MEQLGAGSGTEGVQTCPESALEFIRAHHIDALLIVRYGPDGDRTIESTRQDVGHRGNICPCCPSDGDPHHRTMYLAGAGYKVLFTETPVWLSVRWVPAPISRS